MNKRSPACLLLWFGLAAHGEAQTFTLQPVADTYLRSGSPNQNQGSDTFLRIQSSGNNRSLVRFDSAAITAAVGNGSLASARLELYIESNSNNWSADGRTVDAHRLTASWSEPGATWNCGVDSNPGNSSADCATQWAGGQFAEEPSDTVLHTNGLTGWVRFDVTSDVLAFLSGTPNYGWIVKKTDEGQNGQVEYTSRQGAADHAPRLVLVVESASFDEVPPSLAITAPTRTVLVNEPSPTVTVAYSDGGSGIDPASFQLLIDGQDATTSCTAGTQSASCHPPSLAAGNHTLQAQVRDHAGNSAQSSFSFQLLLGPGPHLVTFQAVGDTYLRKGSSNQNQGGEPILRVQQSGTNRSLVQFDSQSLASTLAGATLVSAALELHVESNGRNWGTQGRTVEVHRLTAPWTEMGATWNCPADSNTTNQQADCATQWNGGSFAPTATASVLHTKDLTGWVSFDVTADVSALLSGTPSYGWLLKKTNEGQSGRMDYDSRQGTPGEGPRLVVVFTTATVTDTTPPTVSIISPVNGSVGANTTPTLRATYSDSGSGINTASVRLILDDVDRTASAQISANEAILTPEPLLPGNHSLSIAVSDLAGNPSQISGAFTVDPVAPLLQIVEPTARVTLSSPNYELTILYSDPFSSVDLPSLQVTIDGTDISSSCVRGTSSATCATPPLTTGQHNAHASIRDLAGNLTEDTASLDLIVDLAPPVLNLLSPQDGALVRSTPLTATGSVSDDGEVSLLTVNGSQVTPNAGSFTAQVNLKEGVNAIQVLATDSTGKQSLAQAVIVLDTHPPALTVDSPRPGSLTNSDTIRVEGQASDENGIARVAMGGAELALEGGRFSQAVPVQDGANSITVQAFDRAGNSAVSELTVTRFNLPEVTITSPTDLSWIAATTITVTGTVSPGVSTVTLNGIPANLSGTNFSISGVPLLEGGSLLTASAVDAQGHVATGTVSVVRDLTAPRLEIYGPTNGAFVTEPSIAVFGLVNDLVPGTVNASQVSVSVNGNPAEVKNRSFLLSSLALAEGDNEIVVEAQDESGNRSESRVSVHREAPRGSRLEIASGDRQSGIIGTELPTPLSVQLLSSTGQPGANVTMLFKVSGNNGTLENGKRQVAVTTDAAGKASVRFTLGTRAGVASQRVEAIAAGYGSATFLEDAQSGTATVIVADSGNEQVGVTGQELPRPFVAVVTDAGHNRLEAVPVKLTVVKGAGTFRNGLQEIVISTDSDGRAIVPFRLDSGEGIAANVVEAKIEALAEGPSAAFTATGWTAGEPSQTAVKGVVLDNSNQPIPGVTIRIKDTPITAQTDAQGVFHIQPAPVGTFYLIVDGSTTSRPGSWPDLEFVMTTVAGREIDLGMPIYLLPLNEAAGLLIDETHGGTLTLPEIPGFALEIKPGSVTFPGGSRSGLVSVTAVHADKVPMVPNFGQQPRFIVTIQPAGARFDPPARLTLPNLEGLAPGEVTEMYSFDHDLGHFVSIGPATVSEDGLTITSNPGVGVNKAGWHCGGNPTSAGTTHNCSTCQQCLHGTCEADNSQ
ncbi:MAG TPA: DNRLRE domain-containing protein, partial [Thermoanaerobaculia bacterium]